MNNQEQHTTIIDQYAANAIKVWVTTTKAQQTAVSKIATDRIHAETGNPNGNYGGQVMPKKLRQELDMITTRGRRTIERVTKKIGDDNVCMKFRYAELRMDIAPHIQDYRAAVESYTENWEAFLNECRDLLDKLYDDTMLPSSREAYVSQFSMKFHKATLPNQHGLIALTSEEASEVEKELVEDMRDTLHGQYREIAATSLVSMHGELTAALVRAEKGQRLSEATFATLKREAELAREFNRPGGHIVDATLDGILTATLGTLAKCDYTELTKKDSERKLLVEYIKGIITAVENHAGQY